MDDSPRPDVLFAGDLDDPWVRAIADALPDGSARLGLVGDLPERWPARICPVRTLVLHRPGLAARDALRAHRWGREGRFTRLVLCVGPHARYAQTQAWSEIAESILPEATAPATIARHADPLGHPVRRPAAGTRAVVVSANHAWRQVLLETLDLGGYHALGVRTWAEAPPAGVAIWDVPVLEPGWPEVLAAACRRRPVVALLGLADRASVTEARRGGAAACLDQPCDPADLLFVLGHVAAGHDLPRPAPDPGGTGSPLLDASRWAHPSARVVETDSDA